MTSAYDRFGGEYSSIDAVMAIPPTIFLSKPIDVN